MPGGSILTTSAPKSDITVAAAGPAIKLAQSMTLSPSKMRSVTCDFLSLPHHGDHGEKHLTAKGRRGYAKDAGSTLPVRPANKFALDYCVLRMRKFPLRPPR